MGRTGEVLAVEETPEGRVVKVALGGNETKTLEHFADAGDDSAPLVGDEVAVDGSAGAGNERVTGYSDPVNAQKTAPGEKRLYVREEDGTLVAELWLKHDEAILEAFKADYHIKIKTTGPVFVESPDVRLGTSPGRQVACVGDIVTGAMLALSAAPGSPIVPIPGVTPTPTGGVPFAAQIVSGVSSVKAGP